MRLTSVERDMTRACADRVFGRNCVVRLIYLDGDEQLSCEAKAGVEVVRDD